MIVVSTTLLIWMSGWAGVIGLATYLVLFFMVAVVTSKTGALRSKTGKIADQRISLMEEMLNAIQVVKMYCWERFFVSNLIEARKKEVKYYKIQAMLLALSMTFLFLSSHMLVIFKNCNVLRPRQTEEKYVAHVFLFRLP